MRPVVLALALGCPLFTPTKKGPPTASWLGDDHQLPRNTHAFVYERWTSVAAPKSTLTLRAGTRELAREDRVLEFEGRARLHELVPAEPLTPGAYTVEWRADGATSETFAFTVGATTDDAPPTFDAARAEVVDNPPDPKCDLWQSWRSASVKAAADDATRKPIYLVWRAADDGLVDLSLPPSHAVSGAGPQVDLGPISQEWLGVAVIDAAGHRAVARDLPIGAPRTDPRARPMKLWVKGASTWILENPMIAGGILFGVLVVVSFGFRKTGDSGKGARRKG